MNLPVPFKPMLNMITTHIYLNKPLIVEVNTSCDHVQHRFFGLNNYFVDKDTKETSNFCRV